LSTSVNSFSAAFFAANRNRLRLHAVVQGPIVIAANLLVQRSSDTAFSFYQEPNFWYFTGIEDAGIVLVIDADDEYLITPKLSHYQEIFDGNFDVSELTRQSGIETVLNYQDGWRRLRTSLRAAAQVATLTPAPTFIETYGMYANPLRRQITQRLKAANPKLEVVDVKVAVAKLRVIKQAPELAAILRAIDITVEALDAVKANIKTYAYEYEIEADITGHTLRSGAQDAWKPTVAGGMNAVTLHARTSDTPLNHDELVVIDIGAQYNHYCADITRTMSLGSQPNQRQQAVYDAVKTVQEYAFGLQKVGANIIDNERLVEHFLGEQLIKLGLIKENTRQNVRKYYTHACSHYLGLDPHDAGDYRQPLEAGMVLTVEPGIYIPEEGIGIRIEDDVLITKTGIKILSATSPRSL
jgi:Xaa-Pro aminopeptidase